MQKLHTYCDQCKREFNPGQRFAIKISSYIRPELTAMISSYKTEPHIFGFVYQRGESMHPIMIEKGDFCDTICLGKFLEEAMK